MGQPGRLDDGHALSCRRTRGTETSHYPQEKKTKCDSPSSGERTGKSPNHLCYGIGGVVGPRRGKSTDEKNVLESPTIEHESCVFEVSRSLVVS